MLILNNIKGTEKAKIKMKFPKRLFNTQKREIKKKINLKMKINK